jgi:hypothetical protein
MRLYEAWHGPCEDTSNTLFESVSTKPLTSGSFPPMAALNDLQSVDKGVGDATPL